MRFVEQLVAINEAYVDQRIHAARFSPAGRGKSHGRRRDQQDHKASRILREKDLLFTDHRRR